MAKTERENYRIDSEVVRLNKFLSLAGLTSRRKADELISSGAVKVNGKVVTELGSKVQPGKDTVVVRGREVYLEPKLLYIVFNKPKDCITTVSDEKGRTTVMDYIKIRKRVYPVGRLDRNTTGVLLLTNDGEFANGLMHPSSEIERAYKVALAQPLSDESLRAARAGVRLGDGIASVKQIELVPGENRLKALIVLAEGRNREVRRIFETLGNDVKSLDRISYGGVTYRGIPRGSWRFLTAQEVKLLQHKIGKTE